jgi:type VI secretion system protein ImpF
MERVSAGTSLVPSVLDRLLDDRPGVSTEPESGRYQNLRLLKRSVARDLEALLNTRREALNEIPPDFVEVNRSLLTYGLPDLTVFNLLSVHDQNRVRRLLEQAISAAEPRLQRIRVNLDAPHQHDRALHFRIEALLRAEPAAEPVTFDAVLQLNTQEYSVKGES